MENQNLSIPIQYFRIKNIYSVIKILNDESKKAYTLLCIALFFLVLLFSVLQYFSKLSPIWAPWDVFILLNGGWRLFGGQIPHVDFSNSIGILAYIPAFLGMKIGDVSSASLVRGIVIFGILFSLAAWIVAKNRMSALFAFLYSCFLFTLTISTRPLGYGITNTSYAMIYNRYGYALFSLLIILLFIPRRFPKESTGNIDGLSTGILLGLLLYCKVTYFMVGCAAIFLYVILNRFRYVWSGLLILGFLLVTIGMLVLMHINPFAYFVDIYTAAKSQSLTMRLINIREVVKSHLHQIFIVYLILYFFAIRRPISIPTIFQSVFRPSLIITFIVGSGIFLSSGNANERSDIPIFFISGLILLNFYNQNNMDKEVRLSKTSIISFMVIIIGTLTLMSQIFVQDTISLVYTIVWNRTEGVKVSSTQTFHSNSLSDFIIPSNSNWKTAYWIANIVPERINEGLNLLRPYINNDTKIFCFCLTDPFSFGLGIQPPLGIPLWWDENISFDTDTYPNQETLFSNTNLVIIPEFHQDDNGWSMDTVSTLKEKYGDYLYQHFSFFVRSDHWLLYKRVN